MSIKKGTDVELTIESAAFKGKGVGKLDGMAVFVPGTAPGDKVLARIVRKKKNFLEAKVLEVTHPSPDRIEPVCSHAFHCGGCSWQHLPYGRQLEFKEQQVRDHMERIAHLDSSIVSPILGCDNPFYYRNKMEYSFGTRRWLSDEEIRRDEFVDDTGLFAGLHAPGRYDKILNLNECHLQPLLSYRLLDEVRSYCIRNKIPAFNTAKNRGFLRHLVIRNSHHTDEWMVNLVTYAEETELMETLSNHLLNEFPEITTIIQNINDQPNPTAVGRYEKILFGPGHITDRIGNHTFRIDANAFFQTNTKQAEKLYGIARNFVLRGERRILYDLYCGVGSLSLYLADIADKVLGIELVEVAVENARTNASENSVSNTEFLLGDMKDTFKTELLERAGRPDCIVTDPPRSGMHPDVVRQLLDVKSPRIVYVSCNPSTMARDLKELKELYEIETVQPVDMFPQTYHIEAVASLALKPH
ncbi:MAG: 23S rRNA (uracil(1939)-C(5))-methyltransferase RlmD [Balneolaceae bacterium]